MQRPTICFFACVVFAFIFNKCRYQIFTDAEGLSSENRRRTLQAETFMDTFFPAVYNRPISNNDFRQRLMDVFGLDSILSKAEIAAGAVDTMAANPFQTQPGQGGPPQPFGQPNPFGSFGGQPPNPFGSSFNPTGQPQTEDPSTALIKKKIRAFVSRENTMWKYWEGKVEDHLGYGVIVFISVFIVVYFPALFTTQDFWVSISSLSVVAILKKIQRRDSRVVR